MAMVAIIKGYGNYSEGGPRRGDKNTEAGAASAAGSRLLEKNGGNRERDERSGLKSARWSQCQAIGKAVLPGMNEARQHALGSDRDGGGEIGPGLGGRRVGEELLDGQEDQAVDPDGLDVWVDDGGAIDALRVGDVAGAEADEFVARACEFAGGDGAVGAEGVVAAGEGVAVGRMAWLEGAADGEAEFVASGGEACHLEIPLVMDGGHADRLAADGGGIGVEGDGAGGWGDEASDGLGIPAPPCLPRGQFRGARALRG